MTESTSWPRERTQRWDAFRAAVLAGADADDAAPNAGLEPLDDESEATR
ncbi:hypothetical protein ACU61A_09415 [Pseudonocardia sichuanensis]